MLGSVKSLLALCELEPWTPCMYWRFRYMLHPFTGERETQNFNLPRQGAPGS